MLDELIHIGRRLTAEAKGKVGNSTISSEFEIWAAQAIFFLEREFKESEVTWSIHGAYSTLRVNTEAKHRQILGALEAAKNILIAESKAAKAIWDLNKD